MWTLTGFLALALSNTCFEGGQRSLKKGFQWSGLEFSWKEKGKRLSLLIAIPQMLRYIKLICKVLKIKVVAEAQ